MLNNVRMMANVLERSFKREVDGEANEDKLIAVAYALWVLGDWMKPFASGKTEPLFRHLRALLEGISSDIMGCSSHLDSAAHEVQKRIVAIGSDERYEDTALDIDPGEFVSIFLQQSLAEAAHIKALAALLEQSGDDTQQYLHRDHPDAFRSSPACQNRTQELALVRAIIDAL